MSLAVALIFAIGSVVCHQLPDRSFFVDGRQLPVCARCTGLYLGAAMGFAGWLIVRVIRGWRPRPLDPRRALMLVAMAATPTIVSFTTGVIGLWDGSNVTRSVLAVPLGLTAGAVVAAVCAKDLR
jgi:uncharacterized membrane protein